MGIHNPFWIVIEASDWKKKNRKSAESPRQVFGPRNGLTMFPISNRNHPSTCVTYLTLVRLLITICLITNYLICGRYETPFLSCYRHKIMIIFIYSLFFFGLFFANGNGVKVKHILYALAICESFFIEISVLDNDCDCSFFGTLFLYLENSN